MKKRFLKNYEDYKSDMTNENSFYQYGFDNFQSISEEEESAKEESTDESEESTKECDCGKAEECDCEKKDKKAEENEEDSSEEDTLRLMQQEDEEDVTDENPDVSDAVDTDDNGLQDITNSFNPLESTAREFSVVKVMTKNGAKIMMCYTCDADEYDTLADNIDFSSACNMVETEADKLGLEKFDNKSDVNLGGIPSFMMDKKATDSESTSYRPQ
jgi:hypothetical protein